MFSIIVTPEISAQFDVERITEDLKQIAAKFPSEDANKAINYLINYARSFENN